MLSLPSLFGVRPTDQPPPVLDDVAAPSIMAESLGREHTGKSMIRAMLSWVTQRGPRPSGLELSAEDPRTAMQWMSDLIAILRGLQKSGLTSTINPTQVRYDLFAADQHRASLLHRDSIGQLLTFTQDGDKKLDEHYRKHQHHLARADVIHVFISCPDDRPANRERFQNDLAILAPNLRAILNGRPADRKLAVALVLTKADTAFATTDEARDALGDERLRTELDRLVRLLEGSNRVGLGAIFVTSALGYGKARRLELPSTGGTTPAKGFSLLSEGEAEWILADGVTPEPHNLTELVWWSIMAGLLLKKADSRGSELARTARMLIDDLGAMKAWIVPLNCRI